MELLSRPPKTQKMKLDIQEKSEYLINTKKDLT